MKYVENMEHLTFIYIFLWILNNIFFIAMIVIGFNISECFMIVVSVIVLKVFTFEKYTCIVSEKNYSGNGKYIVFIGIDGNGRTSSGGMYIDDIEVSLVPTCFLPDNLIAKMYDTEVQLSRMMIDVYSVSGMLVSRQKPTTSPVVIEPIHSAGIYMVVMTSGNSTWQAKLVVE